MTTALRCKLSGHDADPCGVCRRCGDESGAHHQWIEVERARPCFRGERCGGCEREREFPDHDWEATGGELRCRRCRLSI